MLRDLDLAARAPAVSDVMQGLAASTNALYSASNALKAKNAACMSLAREISGRYVALVLAVAPAALEYREDMTEAELRAWAAELVRALA